jgi:regulatory protein
MATITGLRERRGELVDVEVDGAPWRSLPTAAVVRAQLAPGLELDGERLRLLVRELRRAEALTAATRALGRRDLSRQALALRLERRGFGAGDRAEALETLERVGLVDDARYARRRAQSLAERGRGDAAIRWQLESEGVAPSLVEEAIASLEHERARAERIVARRGAGPSTARLLAGRGFSEEVVEASWASASGADP